MQRHYVNTAILWFVLTFVGELMVQNLIKLPLLASAQGVVVDDAFRVLFILGMPVFAFVVSVLVYSLVSFRARGGAVEPGETIHSSSSVSLLWLGITAGLAITVIIHPGLTGLAKLGSNTDADTVVKVTASQWSWLVEYPDGTSTRDELVLPVDRNVKFEITSVDILHSFWIPAFRLKIDAVPGQVTVLHITPTLTGGYQDDATLRVQCAEMCGLRHDTMMMPVRIVAQSEFDAMFGTK